MLRGDKAESMLSAELTCPVCLGTYRDPVSLGCGHCFCRQCITETLSYQKQHLGVYTCPMCMGQYQDFPSLLKNLQLCNIVAHYNSIQEKSSEDCGIQCSYCLGVPNKAVKTCLNCEVSLCQQHLDRHNKKNHILVEPTESIEERKCPEHDKLLEYYCEKDDGCICVTCYIAGSHKGHSIMTLKQAHEKKMPTLSQTTERLANSVSTICGDIENLYSGLTKVKNNTAKLSKSLKDQSDKIISTVRTLFDEIIKTVIINEEQTASQMTAVAKQMEDTKGNVMQILEELNTLHKQADDLLFVKDYLRAHAKAKQQNLQINTLQVLDLNADPKMTKNIEDETAGYIANLSRILKQVQSILSAQTRQLIWSGGKRLTRKNPNLPVFDANIKESKKIVVKFDQPSYKHCNYNMVVSSCFKTVTVKQLNTGYSYKMYNAMNCNCNLSIIICSITRNTFSSKVYCLFDVSKSTNWSVGVSNSISQFYLKCEGNCLSYLSNTILLLGACSINTLKMQLDFDANLLGFYDASSVNDIPLLVCKCDNVFHNSINIGVSVLSGSLTLL